MKKISTFMILTILLSFTISFAAFATPLALVSIDHGDPAHPAIGAPNPGETAITYFKLRNASNEVMNRLVLEGVPGDCVESVQPDLRLDSITPGQSQRISSSLAVKIAAHCARNNPASFLLVGAYDDAQGARKSTWLVIQFRVGQ